MGQLKEQVTGWVLSRPQGLNIIDVLGYLFVDVIIEKKIPVGCSVGGQNKHPTYQVIDYSLVEKFLDICCCTSCWKASAYDLSHQSV